MADVLKVLLDFLKLAPRYLIVLAVVAGLFLWPWMARTIGVQDFVAHNRQWIVLAFLLSSGLFIVDRLIAFVEWAKKFKAKSDAWKLMSDRLESLTEEEKQILRYYIGQQTRSNVLKADDGVVQGLVQTGVIYLASRTGHILYGFPFNITDEAWDYLNIRRDLLDGHTNFYRTDRKLEHDPTMS